jgi:hypothetical protein
MAVVDLKFEVPYNFRRCSMNERVGDLMYSVGRLREAQISGMGNLSVSVSNGHRDMIRPALLKPPCSIHVEAKHERTQVCKGRTV